MKTVTVTLIVNDCRHTITSQPNRTLLDVLREDLHLTGVKDACGGEGECGACTVIMDGKPVNSCLVFIGQADGCRIETIEGVSQGGTLNIIQKSFVEAGAVQCGYCTPGAVMSTKALLNVNSSPNDEEIKEALSGNLCRCTGYSKMIKAVKAAAKEINNGK